MSEDDFPIGVPALEPEQRDTGFLLRLCAGLTGLVVLAWLLLPNFLRARTQPGHANSLSSCKSNCKNIATALEMYAGDNGGRYPARLEQLLPGNYFKIIPTCPAAGCVTYTDYQVSHHPENFSFTCVGNNHARSYTGFSTSSNNYPQYNGEYGLLDHP